MTIFVDTSAFMAFLNEDDQFHKQALDQWHRLLANEESLICNNYILVETISLLQNRFGLQAVRILQDDVAPALSISWVDKSVHDQAIATVMAARRRRLSLVDCSAMATMRVLGVNHIFTFDSHFAEYGFNTIP